MSLVKKLIEQSYNEKKSIIEMEITEENKKEIIPLFIELKKEGLDPEIDERTNSSFLVVNMSKNVINIRRKKV